MSASVSGISCKELQKVSGAIPILPIAIGTLLRVGLMFAAYARTGTRVMTQGDTLSYLNPGKNLFLHGAFATLGLPEIDRTPGYPIFAELTGMLFHNALLTVWAQIFLSVFSLWLVASIAERLFPGRKAGMLAAWLFACEPLSIVACVRIMPETLFVFLLLLCLDRLLRFQQRRQLHCVAQAGLALAAATFVRPVGYYLVFPLAIALGIAVRRDPRTRSKVPLLLLITVLPWLLAWQLRNKAETGYSGFSSIVEKNLYFFQSAEIRAELDHISLEAEQRKLGYPDEAAYIAAHPEQAGWSQAQRLRWMKSEATGVIAGHRMLYLRSHFAGVALVALSPGSAEMLQLVGAYPADGAMPHRLVNEGVFGPLRRLLASHPEVLMLMAIFTAYVALLYLAAAVGLRTHSTIPYGAWTLAGTALYFLLISGGAQAVARYRLPAIPELCILAAAGISSLLQKKRSRRSSSV